MIPAMAQLLNMTADLGDKHGAEVARGDAEAAATAISVAVAGAVGVARKRSRDSHCLTEHAPMHCLAWEHRRLWRRYRRGAQRISRIVAEVPSTPTRSVHSDWSG